MEIILFSVIIAVSLINLIVLIYLSGFLVQFRDEQRQFFRDVIGALSETKNFNITETDTTIKNWDEKYEEELNEVIRRSRRESGLTDI